MFLNTSQDHSQLENPVLSDQLWSPYFFSHSFQNDNPWILFFGEDFDLTLWLNIWDSFVTTTAWKNCLLAQSNLRTELEKSIGSTNQLELSHWALNWKRGGKQSIEIERARNFPCISWPERRSVSMSSRFEQQPTQLLSEQIFFIAMYCSRPGKVERCERSIGQSLEIELGGNFLCISWPRAAQREHDLPSVAPAALITALKSYKLFIIFYYMAMCIAVLCLILQLIVLLSFHSKLSSSSAFCIFAQELQEVTTNVLQCRALSMLGTYICKTHRLQLQFTLCKMREEQCRHTW